MTLPAVAACLLALLLVACDAAPIASTPTPSTGFTPTTRPSVSPLTTDAPVAEPHPGRPYDAEAILDAMRQSRRPGGVPAELQANAIAMAVADAIWTIDGEPWATISAGGSCGPQRCTLEIAGARPGAAGDDAWVFEVDPSSGAVEVVVAELHALSAIRVEHLDQLARTLDTEGLLDDMLLASTRWLPPPDEDRFVLSYRSGGVEGSCARDVTLDPVRGEVVEITSVNC